MRPSEKNSPWSRRTSDHHALAEHQATDRDRDQHQGLDVATPTERGAVARPRAGAMAHRVELGAITADDGVDLAVVHARDDHAAFGEESAGLDGGVLTHRREPRPIRPARLPRGATRSAHNPWAAHTARRRRRPWPRTSRG